MNLRKQEITEARAIAAYKVMRNVDYSVVKERAGGGEGRVVRKGSGSVAISTSQYMLLASGQGWHSLSLV